MPSKLLSGPDVGSVLWFNIADMSDHCSVIFAADAGGWGLLMAKSHWHGAFPSAHKSCTRVLKERWREERTGISSLNFFQAVFTRVVVESSQPLASESMSPR